MILIYQRIEIHRTQTSTNVMMAVLRCLGSQTEDLEGAYCKHFPGVDPMVHVDLKTGGWVEGVVGWQVAVG